jgi:hypothetical protein
MSNSKAPRRDSIAFQDNVSNQAPEQRSRAKADDGPTAPEHKSSDPAPARGKALEQYRSQSEHFLNDQISELDEFILGHVPHCRFRKGLPFRRDLVLWAVFEARWLARQDLWQQVSRLNPTLAIVVFTPGFDKEASEALKGVSRELTLAGAYQMKRNPRFVLQASSVVHKKQSVLEQLLVWAGEGFSRCPLSALGESIPVAVNKLLQGDTAVSIWEQPSFFCQYPGAGTLEIAGDLF